jgi:3-hydroxyisobutyrate dehydrogenase-like beta-hydroxyacid dehydrogenase
MGQVAVLGTGLLGSGFVQAFRKRDVPVRVWNRSRDKAEALVAFGAEVASDPADAVRGAERVHVVLSDDAAVDAVLDAAMPALGGTVIDHTTVSPAGVTRRVAQFRALGKRYLHAPVFMGPVNARDATGLMLVSGPAEAIEAEIEHLRPMTGKILQLGERDDLAAAFKLFGNAALITLCAGVADVLAMARELGVDEQAAIGLFSQFDPSPTLRLRGAKMAKHEWAPASFELSMARKDVRLMIEAAGDRTLTVLPAIAERMDALLARGHGADDLAAIGREDRG